MTLHFAPGLDFEARVGVYGKGLPRRAYIRKKIVIYKYLRLGRSNLRE